MQRVTYNGTELFDRRFNTGADLKGKAHTLAIAKIEPVTVHTERGEQNKVAIYFEKAARPFILGKQFAESIAAALNEYDASKWNGRFITIYPIPSKRGGDTILARPAETKAEKPQTQIQ